MRGDERLSGNSKSSYPISRIPYLISHISYLISRIPYPASHIPYPAVKVIQILPELNAGSVERGTLEVGKYLVEQGHESIVISNGGRLVKQLEAEGSRHIPLPVHKKRLSSLKQIKILRRRFEEEQPDILHLRSRLPAWLAYLAWRKMNPLTRPPWSPPSTGLTRSTPTPES